MKERIIQKLYEDLDWVVEQDIDPTGPTPSGKITVLRFGPFEMEDFERDQTQRESSPLQLTLECEIRGKTSRQSLVMLPAKRAPKAHISNGYLWYYPLVLSKLSKGVFSIISSVFEDNYNARMNLLIIPSKIMEHIIFVNAESLCNVELEDYQYISETLQAQGAVAPLRLEYSTQFSNVETVQFDIETEQVLKVCRLAGDSKKFYKAFCKHILNTTKINLSALQLISISCHIVSLSLSGRFKVQTDT